MKILNPNYVDPVQEKIDTYAQPFSDWILTQPTDKRYITLDEIRAAFPAVAGPMTDGEITAILASLGYDVTI